MCSEGIVRNRRIAMAAAAFAATALTGLTSAPGASATTLTAALTCGGGDGAFSCSLTISGGVAPYSTAWSGQNFAYTSTYYAEGGCGPYALRTATATVTDAVGAQISASSSFRCPITRQ